MYVCMCYFTVRMVTKDLHKLAMDTLLAGDGTQWHPADLAAGRILSTSLHGV